MYEIKRVSNNFSINTDRGYDYKSFEKNGDLELLVEEESSFFYRSHIFPAVYEFEKYPDGHVDTIELIGGKNVCSLKAKLINKSQVPVNFRTEDGQFAAVQQAKDPSGNWISIEHFIHSDCGNSYRSNTIQPGSAYNLEIAQYQGSFQTVMRLKMEICDKIIYSNEYIGSINPEQFTESDYNRFQMDYLFR